MIKNMFLHFLKIFNLKMSCAKNQLNCITLSKIKPWGCSFYPIPLDRLTYMKSLDQNRVKRVLSCHEFKKNESNTFRLEKVLNRKSNKLFVKQRGYNSFFSSKLNKINICKGFEKNGLILKICCKINTLSMYFIDLVYSIIFCQFKLI